ncbi:MAG: hypothetical protein U0L65_02610 [Bacteroidales bacterium]|nr:hypothetical protein [Bacteroidales bacterium]
MKIGIHKTDGFSTRWVEYCERNNIPYKLVNPYENDIIEQLKDCDVFMWHHYHADYRDVQFAKSLLFSLQQKGLKVFPDFNTTWHFDDKVAQKYLLEAIDAPFVPSYVFYTKKDALKWIANVSFPKVFKLKGGAGSSNVKLAKTRKQAKHLIKQAFGKGFSQYDRFAHLKDRYTAYKNGRDSFLGVCKSFARLFIPTEYSKMHSKEKGYVYFQDFIPNNTFDIRICVVDDKAFALKRMCRENDFRASGGGRIIYDKNQIDERCVKIAFDVNDKLKTQSIAFDFVFDENNNPLIVEISYGYSANAYDTCEGYWTKDMQWHAGSNFDFCGWMIEGLIK